MSCEWKSTEGVYFNLNSLKTPTGTIVNGTQSDVYDINICGIAQADGPTGVCAKNNASVCMQNTGSPNW
jgi:hypothetical protein